MSVAGAPDDTPVTVLERIYRSDRLLLLEACLGPRGRRLGPACRLASSRPV